MQNSSNTLLKNGGLKNRNKIYILGECQNILKRQEIQKQKK